MTIPGWYPDPADPSQLRLWDGTAWTDQTQPAPTPPPDPVDPIDTPPAPPPPLPQADRSATKPPTGGLNGLLRGLDRSRIITAIAVVVTIIAIIASIALLASDDDASSAATTEVRLETVNDAGGAPFSEPLGPEVEPLASGAFRDLATDSDGVRRVPGSRAGLYGTTSNPPRCNLDALAAALDGEQAKAEAFGAAVGVPVDQLASWLGTLTILVLREDTRVTNHRYADGRAQPFQSVLQAGTVVAADAFGSPKVRCSCGNPLGPPRTDLVPVFTGDGWENFISEGPITIVAPEGPVDAFEIIDLETGTQVLQPPGPRLL